ncbi:MAG: O-antigen ligase family protein [Rikenellaceae bacterium]
MYAKSLLFWLFYIFIHYLFTMLAGEDFLQCSLNLFKLITWPIFALIFYCAGKENMINSDFAIKLRKFAICCLLLFCARSLYLYFTGTPTDDIYREFFNVNTYAISFLVPFALLVKSNKNKYIILLSVLIIVLTLKRGPLLNCFTGFVFMFCFDKTIKLNKKIYVLVLSALLLLVSYIVFPNIWLSFLARFSAEETSYASSETILMSSRDMIWFTVLNAFHDSSLFNIVFGHGVYQVPKLFYHQHLTGMHAHSDWIHILYDYGIVGLVNFFFIHFSMLRIAFISRKYNYTYSGLLFFIYGSFFASGLFEVGSKNCFFTPKFRTRTRNILN